MLEFPALFRCITFALEKVVAPLTMLWFTYHWAHLPLGEVEPDKELKISSAGVTAGFLVALGILWLSFCFFLKPVEGTLPAMQTSLSRSQTSIEYFKDLGISSSLGFCCAVVVGLIAGGLTAFAGHWKEKALGIKEKTLATGAKVNVIKRSWLWFLIVAGTTGLGVASLATYYTGAAYRAPHLWLMWAYLALLVAFRFVAALKAITED